MPSEQWEFIYYKLDMNETRKQIIDIIEPCMDKSLNFWCMLEVCDEIMEEYFHISWETEFIYVNQSILSNWVNMVLTRHWWSVNWSTTSAITAFSRNEFKYDKEDNLMYTWNKLKILWYYDITAVLKYIDSLSNMDEVKLRWLNFHIWKINEIWINLIPNKPLHLYTEQEEKELLKILQVLNWKSRVKD